MASFILYIGIPMSISKLHPSLSARDKARKAIELKRNSKKISVKAKKREQAKRRLKHIVRPELGLHELKRQKRIRKNIIKIKKIVNEKIEEERDEAIREKNKILLELDNSELRWKMQAVSDKLFSVAPGWLTAKNMRAIASKPLYIHAFYELFHFASWCKPLHFGTALSQDDFDRCLFCADLLIAFGRVLERRIDFCNREDFEVFMKISAEASKKISQSLWTRGQAISEIVKRTTVYLQRHKTSKLRSLYGEMIEDEEALSACVKEIKAWIEHLKPEDVEIIIPHLNPKEVLSLIQVNLETPPPPCDTSLRATLEAEKISLLELIVLNWKLIHDPNQRSIFQNVLVGLRKSDFHVGKALFIQWLYDIRQAYLSESTATIDQLSEEGLSWVEETSSKVAASGGSEIVNDFVINSSDSHAQSNQRRTKNFSDLSVILEENSSMTELNFYNGLDVEAVRLISQALERNNTIQVLNLVSNHMGNVGAMALARLFEFNHTITELNINNNQISDEGAQVIAEILSRNNCAITKLSLAVNLIGDEGAIACASLLENNTSLTRLDLSSNRIGVLGAGPVARAFIKNNTLRTLIFTRNNAGPRTAEIFAEALVVNLSLESLDLRENQLDREGAVVLGKKLNLNISVKRLNLGWNGIGSEGVAGLAEAFYENACIQELNLQNNGIEVEGGIPLFRALEANTSLVVLDISHNELGDDDIKILAPVISKNSSLKTLEFCSNAITAQGARALAKALVVNSSVTELGLGVNNIGDRGTKALAKALRQNTSLKILTLEASEVGDGGAQVLGKALLCNCTLTTLRLNKNNLSKQGAKSLIKALEHNASLTSLELAKNNLGDIGNAFIRLLGRNHTLTTLELSLAFVDRPYLKRISQLLERNASFQVQAMSPANVAPQASFFQTSSDSSVGAMSSSLQASSNSLRGGGKRV